MILVNPFSCTLLEPPRQFDTYLLAATATQLSTFLQLLSHGLIMVGVTANEPTDKLQVALSTLSAIGANVSDVQYAGAFAFVAQKDFPQKTALRKIRTMLAAYIETGLKVTVTGGVKFTILHASCVSKLCFILYLHDYFLTCCVDSIGNSGTMSSSSTANFS